MESFLTDLQLFRFNSDFGLESTLVGLFGEENMV